MANSYRVIRSALFFFFGFLLVGVPMLAFAETVPATGPTTIPASPGYFVINTQTPQASPAAAANDIYQMSESPAGYSHSGPYSGGSCSGADFALGSTVYFRRTYTENGTSSCMSISTIKLGSFCAAGTLSGSNCVGVYSCPGAGWTLSGTTCTRPDCVAPQTRDPATGVCVAPACPAAGTSGASVGATGGFTGSGTMPSSLCINGCSYNTGGVGVQAGSGWATGVGSSLGTSCTGNTAGSVTPPDDPRTKCVQSGQYFGTVNGQVVCTTPSAQATTQYKTTSFPDGSSITQKIVSTTTCKDGNCTTSTNTTTVGSTPATAGGAGQAGSVGTGTGGSGSTGAASGNGTTQQPQPAFCAENPESAMCKGSSFAGQCAPGAAPACEGDAVQCAQATAAWKLQCDLSTEPTSDQYKLGKSLVEGNPDPLGNPLDPSKITQVNVSDIVSSAAGQRTLTGSCIPSPSFTVLGKTFTIDTTLLCRFASVVGYLMIAASSVIAVRMVTA